MGRSTDSWYTVFKWTSEYLKLNLYYQEGSSVLESNLASASVRQ